MISIQRSQIKYRVSRRSVQMCFISITILGLSGCISTEPTKKVSVVQQIQNQEIKDKIDAHVAEFKTIKPAIDRLIAMESDFKIMVSQIAKINSPSLTSQPESMYVENFDYQKESAPVALDPHNNQPTTELLYVSDSLLEPEPIIEMAKAEPILAIPQPEPETITVNEPIVIDDLPRAPLNEIMDYGSEQTQQLAASSSIRLFPSNRYESCAPVGVKSDARKFGIHVASFNSINSLPRGWQESVQRFPDFCDKGAVVQKVIVKNQQYFSLRVGPYVSRSEAKSICFSLKKQKQYCRVTDFTGETL